MVAIDSTFFPYLFNHHTRVPIDPATQKPVEYVQERIELLISTLEENKETIIIPTPALSEFLVLAKQDGPKYLKELANNPLYSIRSFDVMAAIELAAIRLNMEKNLTKKQLKAQSPESTYAKLCFDRQIIAISKANQAHTIYSEDSGVATFATKLGINVVPIWALPKPRETQMPLVFMQSAPNVLQLSAHNTSNENEVDNQESGDGKEAVSEQSDAAALTDNRTVSDHPTVDQTISLGLDVKGNAAESNAPLG